MMYTLMKICVYAYKWWLIMLFLFIFIIHVSQLNSMKYILTVLFLLCIMYCLYAYKYCFMICKMMSMCNILYLNISLLFNKSKSGFRVLHKPCAGNSKIKIVDGSLSIVAGQSYIVFSPLLTIQDILHVPKLSWNLLSISKLTTNKNCQAHFFDTHCVFQDLISGGMIGSAEHSGGLYYFEDEQQTRHQTGPISSYSVKSFLFQIIRMTLCYGI